MESFFDESSCWGAVMARDSAADCTFVYGVRTTKIYCRPTCKARLARRSNVVFFRYPNEAEDAGFRACKRCKPNLPNSMPEEEAERKIRAFISRSVHPGGIELSTVHDMASYVGVSKWHFHRVFREITGITPHEYFKSVRKLPHQEQTVALPTVFQGPPGNPAVSGGTVVEENWNNIDLSKDYHSNFSASSSEISFFPHEYFDANLILGGHPVYFSIQTVSFGRLLVAFQDGRITMIRQGSTVEELLVSLENEFPSLIHEHLAIGNEGEIDTAMLRRIESIKRLLDTSS